MNFLITSRPVKGHKIKHTLQGVPFPLVLKDREGEIRIVRERVLASIVIMGLLMLIVIVRLTELQILNHDHYTTLSQDNRVKILPLAPTRGLIFSRDGRLLADNRPSFSLEVVPERVADLRKTLEELAQIVSISEEDSKRFFQEVKRRRRFDNVPLRFNLSEEEVARFSVNRYRFPGFDIVARHMRFYPLGEQMAHVVGYVGRINEAELKSIDTANYSGTNHIGKTGVERSYEAVLHGRIGYQQVEANAQGRIVRVLKRHSPIAGKNLHLTIDTSLQSLAIEALGERRGAVVALDTQTGGVLALVSKPSFDPNLFVNGIGAADYARLRDAPERPLFNRALQGKYPPGSTIKPMFGLATLEQGLPKTGKVTWCPGGYRIPGQAHTYRCWNKRGHGRVDLKRAIAQSCDVYFYHLAYTLGIDRVHQHLSRFGFGQLTGIDLPGESAGLLPSSEWKRKIRHAAWYAGETVITGIGQGYFLATPLQLTHAVAMMANRGSTVRPTVIHRTDDLGSSAQANEAAKPEFPKVMTRPEHWDTLIEAMIEVVRSGTASRAGQGAAYPFAGKTGTAQVFGIKDQAEHKKKKIPEHLQDHAWFIAFAPADHPRIAVTVLVENGGHGSQAAAPIARKLFDHFLLGGTPQVSRHDQH
jgi:penicillin-binding protein 2